MKAFVGDLKDAGLEPALVQGYTNQQADFTPVALAVRQSGADILCSYFTFETDLGVFARQLRQLGVRVPWVGSPPSPNISALNLAGPALYGTFGVADYAVDATPPPRRSQRNTRRCARRRRTTSPPGRSMRSTSWARHQRRRQHRPREDPHRDPGAIKGYAGAEGEYNFDANGDGLHGYNVVKNESGKIVFDKRVDFPAA